MTNSLMNLKLVVCNGYVRPNYSYILQYFCLFKIFKVLLNSKGLQPLMCLHDLLFCHFPSLIDAFRVPVLEANGHQ